jgi:inner membrane protein
MDPVTHGLVGLVLGLIEGGPISLTNGMMTASLAGSLLPDLDIIFQLRGDFAYLKQHRGCSHSIPIALLSSGAGALILHLFYPDQQFVLLFGGVLLGFFSHLFLDLLNSYGVKILWPFSQIKYTWNLLPLIDPMLILLCILSMLLHHTGSKSISVLPVFGLYFVLRWSMRLWAGRLVRNTLRQLKNLHRIFLLPAGRLSFWQWDFIVLTAEKKIVGTVNLLWRKHQIFRELADDPGQQTEYQWILGETPLGQVFREFTPFVHIKAEKMGDFLICSFMDLRYRVENRFLHNGVMVLNQNKEVEKAFFLPYSTAHRIPLV